MPTPTAAERLIEVLAAYHDFNSSIIEERSGAPTPLQFSRCIRQNFPVVFRGAVAHWKAVRDWRVAYLREKMGGEAIAVAETPLGWVLRPQTPKSGLMVGEEMQILRWSGKRMVSGISSSRMRERWSLGTYSYHIIS